MFKYDDGFKRMSIMNSEFLQSTLLAVYINSPSDTKDIQNQTVLKNKKNENS